jgi:hypothetical protein
LGVDDARAAVVEQVLHGVKLSGRSFVARRCRTAAADDDAARCARGANQNECRYTNPQQ